LTVLAPHRKQPNDGRPGRIGSRDHPKGQDADCMLEGQGFKITRPWPVAVALLRGKSVRQVLLFLIVGFTNTILSYVIYLGLLQIWHYAWAFTGAFVLGLIYTGLLNIRVTFARQPTVAACVVFSAYYGLYYVFALLLLRLFVEGFGIDEHYAPVLMLPIVVPINFVMTRFIVHRFGRALS
jgi:putative flippase GtrA